MSDQPAQKKDFQNNESIAANSSNQKPSEGGRSAKANRSFKNKKRKNGTQPTRQNKKPQKNKNIIQNNNQKIYGAIDLGTNNCRLLVARPTKDGFRVIDAFSRIVRLGEGLTSNGILSQDAIDRTIEALNICVAKMKRRGVTHMRNVATQACREAENCDEFVERVEKEVRIKLDIIDPAEEARLAVMGCKALLEKRYSNAIVFDIGGGSTELIWVKISRAGNPHIIDWTSVPYGVVNLSEKYGTRDAVSPENYQEMKKTIQDNVMEFAGKNDMQDLVREGRVQLLGTSGTITTLTSMHLDLEYYNRNLVDGAQVSRIRMQELCTQLSSMDYEQRVALKSIGVDRAELVVAGCSILEVIMDLWPIEHIRVADRGIREGMLLELMAAQNPGRRNNYRRRFRKKKNKSGNMPEKNNNSQAKETSC